MDDKREKEREGGGNERRKIKTRVERGGIGMRRLA